MFFLFLFRFELISFLFFLPLSFTFLLVINARCNLEFINLVCFELSLIEAVVILVMWFKIVFISKGIIGILGFSFAEDALNLIIIFEHITDNLWFRYKEVIDFERWDSKISPFGWATNVLFCQFVETIKGSMCKLAHSFICLNCHYKIDEFIGFDSQPYCFLLCW